MKKTVCGLAVVAALVSGNVLAHQEGDFIVRAGLAMVSPNDSSDKILGSDKELQVDSDTQIGLTFGYMLTDNISLEVLAATPFKHTISTDLLNQDIGETKHLPPTFMVQYYFGEASSDLRPYVGVGINYTTFFDESFNSNGTAATLSNLKLDDSWGLAANVGLDYMLNEDWFINGSIWYADIDTTATFDHATLGAQSVDISIDPWVFMIGGGYKF
ncbi:outer membrane protein OmpW [Vibrio coralliilyticus]|uniref:outer membrane protein OmpW n=1 Tax=Vibrio coralliilyticus TaxID=190893 RepID=UPI000512869E|nr:outer membrane protein OmpW [Vibrio coralliilyticus]AIS57538.1 membrane protein [Vibrio coralliilyticus]